MIAEVQVAGQNAALAVQRRDRILDMHVVDPVRERPNEFHRVHELPMQMAGIEIEAELLAVVQRFERLLSRVDVEGDLRGMDLQTELDAAFAENVQNRIETFGQQLEARFDHRRRYRRERIVQMPDAGTRETVHDADPELLSRTRRVLQLFDRSLLDSGRITVSPHVRGQDHLCRSVDQDPGRLGRPDDS
jgi:hypothetical protein